MENSIYHLNEITMNRTSPDAACNKIPEIMTGTEMSRFDGAFLCGMLQRNRPRKIVEVGVASGGTTAIVMQCMRDLDCSFEMYSVELLDYVHCAPEKKAGYIGEKAKELLEIKHHRLFTGKCLPEVVHEIGDGIDFLILDTTHTLPGEVLDFLAAYPFLSPDAVVCMHDIRQNFKSTGTQLSIATNALFSAVAAEKYINEDMKRTHGYPNIGAFQITGDTGKYITNIASCLMLPWKTTPNEEMIAVYLDAICPQYGPEVEWILRCAVSLNSDAVASIRSNSKNAQIAQPKKTRSAIMEQMKHKLFRSDRG